MTIWKKYDDRMDEAFKTLNDVRREMFDDRDWRALDHLAGRLRVVLDNVRADSADIDSEEPDAG